jgi:hypothetical protein
LLWLAAAGITIMIAVAVIPVKLNDLEFGDYMEEQAQFSGRATVEAMRKRILKRAQELEIPLKAKNLSIEKGTARVRIKCKYTVTLEFPFYTYDWDFWHDIDRPVFIV